MKLNFSSLTTISEDDAFNYVLGIAKSFGFPATSFQSGSIGYSLLRTTAHIVSLVSESVQNLSNNIYLKTAQGYSLDLIGENHFSEPRKQETKTIITPKIRNNGPTQIGPYDASTIKIKVFKETNQYGEPIYIEYVNDQSITIQPDGYINSVEFSSLLFGEETRASTINVPEFDPPIANLTFESISQDNGYFLLIQEGQNAESDEDYRVRCRAKWGTLSANGPEAAYNYWIKTSKRNSGEYVDITRVTVDRSSAEYNGVIVIFCASSTGDVSTEDLDAARENVLINRPVCTSVSIDSAIQRDVYFTLTVSHLGKYTDTELKRLIVEKLTSFTNQLNIGGTVLDGQGYILASEVIASVMEVDSVVDVVGSRVYSRVGLDAFSYINFGNQPLQLEEVAAISDQLQTAGITLKIAPQVTL